MLFVVQMHKNVHSHITYNSKILASTQMFIPWGISKQTQVNSSCLREWLNPPSRQWYLQFRTRLEKIDNTGMPEHTLKCGKMAYKRAWAIDTRVRVRVVPEEEWGAGCRRPKLWSAVGLCIICSNKERGQRQWQTLKRA